MSAETSTADTAGPSTTSDTVAPPSADAAPTPETEPDTEAGDDPASSTAEKSTDPSATATQASPPPGASAASSSAASGSSTADTERSPGTTHGLLAWIQVIAGRRIKGFEWLLIAVYPLSIGLLWAGEFSRFVPTDLLLFTEVTPLSLLIQWIGFSLVVELGWICLLGVDRWVFGDPE